MKHLFAFVVAIAVSSVGVSSVAVAAPAGWTCNPAYYGANDGCDCGCGVPDPDCGCAGCTGGGCVAPGCDYCAVYGSMECGPNRDANNYVGPQTQPGARVVLAGQKACCGYPCGDVRTAVVSIAQWMHDHIRSLAEGQCVQDRYNATAEQLLAANYNCFDSCSNFAVEFVAIARQLDIPCQIEYTIGFDSYLKLTQGAWPVPSAGHAFVKCEDIDGSWFYYNASDGQFPTDAGAFLSASAGDPSGWYVKFESINDFWSAGVRGVTDWEQWVSASTCPGGRCIPATWTCPTTWYSTNDGCDCGCGYFDQDCGEYDGRRGCPDSGCRAPECQYFW